MAWGDNYLKSFFRTTIRQTAEATVEIVLDAIDDNKKIVAWTHRVGSHSDDFDGESNFPCDCRDKEIEIATETLSALRKKVEKRAREFMSNTK